MNGQKRWAELVAARVTGAEPPPEEATTEPTRPAWARVAVDRAAGRTPDPETVREAREGARRPRAEWEQRLLARIGHDTEDDGPDAA